jgi:dihydrofolate reductase
MGRVILQMMLTLDGMASGPQGEMDWIAQDEALNRAHKETLEQSDVAVLGAGAYPEMAKYWIAAEHDEKTDPTMRAIARAFNAIPKIVYSHKDMPVTWNNTKIHVVADDDALVKDVQRVKQETKRIIIVYGGVRLARTFVRRDLPDQLNLDICPVILGAGQPLLADLTHRTNLRLRHSTTYDSGAVAMYYDVVKTSGTEQRPT